MTSGLDFHPGLPCTGWVYHCYLFTVPLIECTDLWIVWKHSSWSTFHDWVIWKRLTVVFSWVLQEKLTVVCIADWLYGVCCCFTVVSVSVVVVVVCAGEAKSDVWGSFVCEPERWQRVWCTCTGGPTLCWTAANTRHRLHQQVPHQPPNHMHQFTEPHLSLFHDKLRLVTLLEYYAGHPQNGITKRQNVLTDKENKTTPPTPRLYQTGLQICKSDDAVVTISRRGRVSK